MTLPAPLEKAAYWGAVGGTACWKEEAASSIQAQRESHPFPFPAFLCVPRREVALRPAGVMTGGQSAGREEMGRVGERVVEDDGGE